jgi:hypothetical protein
MKQILIALIFLALISKTEASITEEGKGILFGNDHVFSFTATNGWVLDNQSAINQGLHMVFYLKNQTWKNSPVIMYGRSVPLSHTKSIKEQVETTVSYFINNGSPNYKSEEKTIIPLDTGKQAKVYHFSGDKWGNYEAVAYIKEIDTINYIVLNSRSKKHFDQHLSDFYQIVASYSNLYASPSEINPKKIKQLEKEYERLLNSSEGKKYKTNAINSVGQKMSNTLRECTSYLPQGEKFQLTYFTVIRKNGNIIESLAYPINALSNCFRGLMHDTKFPKHDFNEFTLKIDIKITP